jgi:hypothetical protein
MSVTKTEISFTEPDEKDVKNEKPHFRSFQKYNKSRRERIRSQGYNEFSKDDKIVLKDQKAIDDTIMNIRIAIASKNVKRISE